MSNKSYICPLSGNTCMGKDCPVSIKECDTNNKQFKILYYCGLANIRGQESRKVIDYESLNFPYKG